jgi:iron(II)-dependent oxidoreductase
MFADDGSQSAGDKQPPPTEPGEMVLIKAGEFIMGKDGDADHSPAHKVRLDAFYLDKCEVTNAQYYEYVRATKARLPEFWEMSRYSSGPDFPNHPVVGIAWNEAKAYAEWAGKRLPTEAEWEYAARGGLVDADYPNGRKLEPDAANYWDWSTLKPTGGGIVPTGSYPANGFGLHDMAGNVVEWVADFYDEEYYRHGSAKNPTGPDAGKFRVIRGGGWHSGPSCNRVYFRNALPAMWRDFSVGFRCAKNVSQEPAGD